MSKNILKEVRDDLAKTNERCNKIIDGAIEPAALIETWMDLNPEATKKNEIRARVSTSAGSLQGVLVHVDVDKVEEVGPVLKLFKSNGWHQKKDPEDYAEIQRRSWYLQKEDVYPEVIVSAFFRGETCKFIKVGEEKKDVFELKCEPAL